MSLSVSLSSRRARYHPPFVGVLIVDALCCSGRDGDSGADVTAMAKVGTVARRRVMRRGAS